MYVSSESFTKITLHFSVIYLLVFIMLQFSPTIYNWESGFGGICNYNLSFSFPPCLPVNPSNVWRLWKWGIKSPHRLAKSNWTLPWKIFSLLMVCRLDREYAINEWDYTQPSLTGLWFITAQFSCAIQLYSSFSLPSVFSFPPSLLSSLTSLC